MPINPADLDSVREVIQFVADATCPSHRGAELSIRTPLGPLVVAVGPPRPAGQRAELHYEHQDDHPDADLSTPELDIMQVMREAGAGVVLEGEEIAAKVGRECNSYFRRTLSGLVQRGRLARPAGRAGYFLPA